MFDLMLTANPPFHINYFLHFEKMVDNEIIFLYVWAVVIDIVTGFAKSIKTRHITSTKGLNGLLKHVALMILILTIYPVLDILKWNTEANIFVTFYILFYVVSIIENLGQMGIPFPEWLKKYLYKLSDEYNQGPKDKK